MSLFKPSFFGGTDLHEVLYRVWDHHLQAHGDPPIFEFSEKVCGFYGGLRGEKCFKSDFSAF